MSLVDKISIVKRSLAQTTRQIKPLRAAQTAGITMDLDAYDSKPQMMIYFGHLCGLRSIFHAFFKPKRLLSLFC